MSREKASEKRIKESKDYPVGVHHDSPFNSTAFTNCCNTAITDRENCCPSCGLYVVGWDSFNTGNTRFDYAYRGKK